MDLIIDRARIIQGTGRDLAGPDARSILLQILRFANRKEEKQLNGNIGEIIELASQLREEGVEISLHNAKDLIKQLNWSVGNHARFGGREDRALRAPIEPPVKINRVSSAEFNALCKDKCKICMDNHTLGESILTDCGHAFGHQCWHTWIMNCIARGNNRTCPECNKCRPVIERFARNSAPIEE